MDELVPPTPPAPEAPPAPPTPPAPEAPPAAPAVPPIEPTPPKSPSEDEAQAEADAKEWADAAKDAFPGLDKKEPAKDEPEKPAEDGKKPEAGKENPDPKKPDEKSGDGDDAKDKGKEESGADEEPDTLARDTRLAQREAAREVATMKADVRAKMFKELPFTELKDGDGDLIRNAGDVQRLINPDTKQPFTKEEAEAWFANASQQVVANQKTVAAAEKQIEQIADVNLGLKDEADVIKNEFGELLKAMPELRDSIWAEFNKTLTTDKETGIIIKAPVSLETFYRTVLAPYAKVGKQLESQEAAKVAEAEKAKADAAAAETARKQNRADRSDIYGGGKPDVNDPEAKEWADAATAVFGPYKGK